MSLFGTDGIRAVAGKSPLTKEELEKIGFAAGKVLLSKGGGNSSCGILIGRDTRESGPWIEEALAKGLSASGCAVISCGVLPTAAISAMVRKNKFLGGSVISASHNPPEFNGVKFFTLDGRKLPEGWEKEIEERLGKGNSFLGTSVCEALSFIARANDERVPQSGKRSPKRSSLSLANEYNQFLKKSCLPSFSLKGKKWVIDCANGSASVVAPEIFRSLGADLVCIADKPNGKNINVGCGVLHLDLLREKVLKEAVWGGCAFDGDADRVLFVDEKGEVLDGDILIALAAEDLHERGLLSGNCVVTTVMANFGFFQWMKRAQIEVVTTPVGDRSVSEKISEIGASLGGEQSGHIIFGDTLPTGDGLLTALKILEILAKKEKPLSYYRSIYPKTPQVLVNLRVKEKIPIEKVPSLKRLIESCQASLGENGRLLVRYSGTEPLLRIMVEGNSLEQIRNISFDILNRAKHFL